jgi:hypothetical protein
VFTLDPVTLDPVLAWSVRLVAVCLLAAAAGAKLAALEPFVGVVRNYRLLPAALARPLAYLIPPLELLIAAAILVFPSAMTPLASAGLLLLGFAGAMAINLVRGRAEIDCGCFLGFMRQRLSWTLVIRNVLLSAALLAVASTPASARVLLWFDWLTIAAAVPSLLLIWAITSRLLGTASRAALAEAG